MEKISIQAERREGAGKGSARTLRRDGKVPAVLYRAGKAQSIQLSRKELSKLINTVAGEQVMVDLLFADGDKKLALLKDYQVDPIGGELLHTDFFEVSLTETLRITVHVSTTGEPIGVKRDGGMLQHPVREIQIECLPDKIPGKIEIDISKLEVGQSVHVSDLKLEEGIKILTDPHEVIANVVAAVEEAAAPAAEAVEAAPAEPEVVKKGKKEEEGAAPEKEKKGK
ncbi:MAG TPA: 50S ribosomal protein L25 [Thermodesulfovibrionales bacterium]|nr:50S ribosomal protein L25 [Thermodesulfovibrionales bacterium]